jgi:Mlc titration factor MtfA (ptsG expression regulator)
MPALIITGLALAFIAALLARPRLIERKRRQLRLRTFPVTWREILAERVPLARTLPSALYIQLQQHMQVFLEEKAFIGCDGLQVTDEMRVTIAAQACLLLLGRTRGYYPTLHQVLLYPGVYMVTRERVDANGLVNDDRQFIGGESWEAGQVVLSWQTVLDDAADPHSGHNIVLHEFAHQIDSLTGASATVSALSDRPPQTRWAQILTAEYHLLCRAIDFDEPHLMRDYGGTSPVEFFAVISEVFFTQPRELASAHPALYFELSGFYALEPVAWV